MRAEPACPVYVINLPRDLERREWMERQLNSLALECRPVTAVYGADLSPAARAQLYCEVKNQSRFHSPMTAGEIGCYASHQRTWQQIVDDGVPMALVLEDDVTLGQELPEILTHLARYSSGWDMVKLIGRQRETISRRWSLTQALSLVRYRRVPSLASAYVLSAAGARKLASSRRPFYRPVDVDFRYWWENGLRVYGVQPYPVSLAEISMQSSIGPRKSPTSLAYRWRRFRDQCGYTWTSLWANRSLRNEVPLPD